MKRKTFNEKCSLLAMHGWKLTSAIFFGGCPYATFQKENQKMEVTSYNGGSIGIAYFCRLR